MELLLAVAFGFLLGYGFSGARRSSLVFPEKPTRVPEILTPPPPPGRVFYMNPPKPDPPPLRKVKDRGFA